MQFGHGRIIKNHTGAEAGTQFSQNRRFHFGVHFRAHFGSQNGLAKSWFSRPGGRDGLGQLPWRPQEPSERSQEPSQEASRAVREPSRAAQEASRVVRATSTSRPGGPKTLPSGLCSRPGGPKSSQRGFQRCPRGFASVPRAHRAMDQPFQHTRPDPSGLKGGFRIVGVGEG